MKFRSGFVSNSSSSSFIVNKYKISKEQIDKIINHAEEYAKLSQRKKNLIYGSTTVEDMDTWDVDNSDEDELVLSTYMDNFNMEEFLKAIGVPEEGIRLESY